MIAPQRNALPFQGGKHVLECWRWDVWLLAFIRVELPQETGDADSLLTVC